MIATIAVIAAIYEKKKVQRFLSLWSLESGFHMIAGIADFFFSQRSQRSQRSYGNQPFLWQIREKICSKLEEMPEGLQGGKGCTIHR